MSVPKEVKMKSCLKILASTFAYRHFRKDMPVKEVAGKLYANVPASWIERMFPHWFAAKYYDKKGQYIATPTTFCRYSPSYVLTNENMRGVVQVQALKPANMRVLTCGGSGDQEKWFAAYGAKSVDSFDISYCSRIVTEIKDAAMQTFDFDGFTDFIRTLGAKQGRIQDLPEYEKIKHRLSRRVIKFMRSQKNKCFCNNRGTIEVCFPERHEFNKMQIRPTNGKFIWSDLENLHKKLRGEYDIIYLSNIFKYISDEKVITSILYRLATQHLTPLGKIAVINSITINSEKYKMAINALKKLGEFKEIKCGIDTMLVFEKKIKSK